MEPAKRAAHNVHKRLQACLQGQSGADMDKRVVSGGSQGGEAWVVKDGVEVRPSGSAAAPSRHAPRQARWAELDGGCLLFLNRHHLLTRARLLLRPLMRCLPTAGNSPGKNSPLYKSLGHNGKPRPKFTSPRSHRAKSDPRGPSDYTCSVFCNSWWKYGDG